MNILRIDEVTERVGLSRATIWRREQNGEFPSRRDLGGSAVGWVESEINEWISDREKVHADNY